MPLKGIQIVALVAVVALGIMLAAKVRTAAPGTFAETSPTVGEFDTSHVTTSVPPVSQGAGATIAIPGSADDTTPFLSPATDSPLMSYGSAVRNTTTEKPSEEVQALKAYGNAVGAALTAHFARQPNQIQNIEAYLQDMHNAKKAQRVDAIASDIDRLHRDLKELKQVPPMFQSAHSRLVRAYADLATQFHAIAKSSNETTLVSALNAYNTAEDEVTRAYSSIALVYAAAGITFGNSEPGSMFNPQ